MHPITYQRRPSRLSSGERAWRVDDDALVSICPAGKQRRLAWDEIVSLRLCHEPARGRPWRYVFALQPKHGPRTEIDNAHFVQGGYEDRSASFTPFVRAAIARVHAGNPKARALIGETPKRYFFLLLGVLVAIATLAITLTLVRTPLDALAYATPIKLALVLLTVPILWQVIRAMPRGLALDAIPERALPPAPASAIEAPR
jgi:hypothetical protein